MTSFMMLSIAYSSQLLEIGRIVLGLCCFTFVVLAYWVVCLVDWVLCLVRWVIKGGWKQ